jgi:tetratricopeptide (TPR) repeat protein
MTKVTPLNFLKTLPLRRETLTHPLTLLFGAAIAGLTVGVILYRRWNVQPTSFDMAKKAFTDQQYELTLRLCDEALRTKQGMASEIELLRIKVWGQQKAYYKVFEGCGTLLQSTNRPKTRAFFADLHLQWGKALFATSTLQRDRTFAIGKLHKAWEIIYNPADPHACPRLKFEILMATFQAYRKSADMTNIPDKLDLAFACLHMLNPAEEVSVENRSLFFNFYYTRMYYFIDMEAYKSARIESQTAWSFLDPSNDHELEPKVEILLLRSLILSKGGDTEAAFSIVCEALALALSSEQRNASADKPKEMISPETLKALSLLHALFSSGDFAISNCNNALKAVKNDELFQAAILYKRGELYLQQGRDTTSDNALDFFKKALEDFELAQQKATGKVSESSDLLKCVAQMLELTKLQEKIKERLADQGIVSTKKIRQLEQHAS